MPDILINDIRPRTQVLQGAGLAVTNTFDFGFPVLAESDLRVAVDATVQDPSDYTVAGVGEAAGGSVTLSAAPAEGARITMWRDMPFQRTTDFTPGADLRAAVLNDELDRTALLLQQAEALVGDSIHRRPYDTDVELTLPPVEDRAGMLLSFDANGRPETVNAKISGNISSFALIYLGTAPTANAPTVRMDGSALQVGDFYFDTDLESLMTFNGTGWSATLTPADSFLPRNGSGAMTGALDMGGNNVSNVGLIDGRSVSADGAVLDSLNAGLSDNTDLAIRNAWEIARLDGLGPQGLMNTYLDNFTDSTGIDAGASSNYHHDPVESLVANFNFLDVVSDAGLEDTVFDGAGGQGGWSSTQSQSGITTNFSAGMIDGKTAMTFSYAAAASGEHYIEKDTGNFGTESVVTLQARFSAVESLGTVSGNAYTGNTGALFRLFFIYNGSRRSHFGIDSSGAIYLQNGSDYHKMTSDGVVKNDTWHAISIWNRIDSANNVSDVKIWVDGTLLGDHSGLSVGTEPTTQGDGKVYVYCQNSASNGTTTFVAAIHSITAGQFPTTAGDTFFNKDRVSGQYTNITGGGAVGDFAQSFQVSDTTPIIGGGIAIYDGTAIGSANNVTFTLYGDSAGAPDIAGGALATCTEDISRDLNSAEAAHWFTFDVPFTPTPGTTYWLSVTSTTTFRMKYDPAGGYPNGQGRSGGVNGAWNWCFWVRQNRTIGLSQVLVSQTAHAPAGSPPSELRALLDIEEIDAATENTDFSAWVSRNGGVSWAQVSLSAVSGNTAGRAVYAGTTDVSSQTAAEQCRLRFTTANNKELRLHRWALQADQLLSL